MTSRHVLVLAPLALAACGGSSDDLNAQLLADRPYELAAPSTYDDSPTPLIVTLHGLGETGLEQATQSGLLDLVDQRGFILAYPDGTAISAGLRGWNASCCDPTLEVDDVAYLRAVIGDVSNHYNVDPKRIYVTGYSNGAFMAHLFACRAADLVAAISVYAGTMLEGEETECSPSAPVAVMHTHGTDDATIDFDGGTLDFGLGALNYISASLVVQTWIGLDDCPVSPAPDTFDVDNNLTGDDTTIQRYEGCAQGTAVELWRVDGGTHVPSPTEAYQNAVVDFLFSHPKL